ncbi:MAG: molybdopterin-dependent oxidoreductase [Pikeienuella sp.]
MNAAPPLLFTLNGAPISVALAQGRRLSDVLREECNAREVKVGCDAGDCGACTVLLNGAPVCACLTPVAQAGGADIVTARGLSDDIGRGLRAAFHRHGAAQCGICTPGMMMAARAVLQGGASPDRAQIEDAIGGVLCRCTGYAKIVDAIADFADTKNPHPPAAGEAVGQRALRLDGDAKVEGTEVFGADYWPEDALMVRAIRAPHHRADFVFGDLEAWRAANGVDAVFTAADIPGRNAFGVIPPLADQPALAESSTRMRGEAVALVAGERDVVEALDLDGFPITWTPLAPSLTCAESTVEGAPLLHGHRPGNILIKGRVVRGDAAKGLAAAAHVADASIETSFVEHAYIEPEAGAAWLDGDVLTIQACTQAPVMDRDDVALVLGLPQEKVRIIPAAAGGGFGSKLDVSLQPLIGLVTLKTGRPCRMVYSRRESMASTTKRHKAHMRGRIGVDAAGRIVGMEFDGDFNTGPYSSWGPTVATRVPVHASGPYKTPHYRAETRAIHTHASNCGAFRGFGVPQAAILQETIYDKLADAAGVDRLAFRRLNALQDGDVTVCGQTLYGVGIAECLDALAPAWETALADATAFNAAYDGVRRGVGVASCWYGCGNTALPNPSTVRVGLNGAGRVVLHQGATDIGQGSNTVITQICADALGLPLCDFDLIGPDTALTPDCGKTSASRQTFVTGKAAQAAGHALRALVLRLTNMGAGATLSLGNGQLIATENGVTRAISLADLPLDERGYVLSAEETYDPPTTPLDADGQGAPYAVYGYGAQLAEVEVDVALGVTRVLRMVAAHDLGKVINPMLAEGQIEGGIAQGLGLALMEEYVPGRTENLHDYLIPTSGDMPEITSILIEKPDPEGPMGAKGLGEHVLIPTAPAIFNAIRHATGADITMVPALPHRVRAAIVKAQNG